MPKYCSVPNCKNDSASDSDRKSFYRFPLQDPVRLQQWLRNMGRENWAPSRHQYICHEHFAPSCFKVRWGIRYLERDAVPTVFQEAEKRKATDDGEKKPKRLRTICNPSVSVSDDKTMVFDTADMQNKVHTVHLYQIAVDPSQQEETSLVQLSDVGESDSSFEPELDSLATVDRLETGVNFPLTVLHTIDHLSNSGEKTEVVLMSECPAGEGQNELMNEITAAILTQGHRLVVNDSTLECTDEAVALSGAEDVTHTTELFSDGDDDNHETQVIAYFETIPNVLPKDTFTQFTFSPETVLSSALSSTPITSTLPIVSKHAAPSPTSLVLTLERLDSEGGEGDEGKSEDDDTEQDYQLEEHCYHKNSLSKEQLEGIVCELQKKVKVLQQRHRRHLEKLVGLENTVSQLRQSNLLNEERLQLLERAYMQTNGAVSDAGETVTIIYEEDDAAYLYTPLMDTEAKL